MTASAEADGTGFLMVRSRLADLADRPAFDSWYGEDHAPLAARRLGARNGRRFWSVTDPHVHCALYEFGALSSLEAALASEVTAWLIEEYDRHWPAPRVTRTREVWAAAGDIAISGSSV